MYVPDPVALHDRAAIAGLLRRHSFALLVTAADGAPQARHLPFLYDPARGPKGTLTAHLARANPQAAKLNQNKPAEERLAAAAALRDAGGAQAREVAALMESPALDP